MSPIGHSAAEPPTGWDTRSLRRLCGMNRTDRHPFLRPYAHRVGIAGLAGREEDRRPLSRPSTHLAGFATDPPGESRRPPDATGPRPGPDT